MKILICHNYYRYRGGEDEVVDFEKNLLNKNGYEVMEYYKYSSNIDNWFKNFKLFFSVFFSLKTVFELNRIIKTIRPDVAHIHNIFPIISPSIYYILKKNHIHIVQTIHNYRFYCSNGLGIKNGRLCDKCLKLSFKNLFQVCSEQRIYDFALKVIMFFMGRFNTLYTVNYFIAPSEFMKKKLAMFNINEERIAIKRNSLNVIENSDESKEKKENYFTFIGRLSEEKGIMDLIYSFK